jgi:hypothetical protein
LPAISPKAQDLIKKLFSISEAGEKDKDTTALDGAVVLAKFGQYERALIELNELLREDSLRVVAAKNILRCKMAISSTDDVVAQFQEWQSSRLFLPEQLETVYIFMNTLLDRKKKADRVLPEELESPDFTQNGLPQEGLHQEELQQEEFSDQETRQAIVSDQPGRDQESETTETTEEEILDISAIAITFKSGPIKGRPIELDVSFQSGNTISLIIPRQEQALIDNLKVGGKLDDVQFYSPIAIFKGSGVVTSSTKIKTGPKQGDYCLDIKVVSN